MGFSFDGFVLRPPRISPANFQSTGEPNNGVIRSPSTVPDVYDIKKAQSPEFVDAYADQYRAAVLDGPGSSPVEYLVWAQNTAQLAIADSADWWAEQGSGTFPVGTLTVQENNPVSLNPPLENTGVFFDGTGRVVITDDGGRSLGLIVAVVVARGDVDDYDDDGWWDVDNISQGRAGTNPYPFFEIAVEDQNPAAGTVDLTVSQLASLDGGLSQGRGDQIVGVRYTLSSTKVWWTRNDRYETRFGWVGSSQKWEPYKGSSPRALGRLYLDQAYSMSPKVANLPVNAELPGSTATPDAYAMIRLGETPSLSLPVERILVRPNNEVAGGFDFTGFETYSAVMGQSNGVLEFNPSFAEQNAGKSIWYVFKTFSEKDDGVLGKLSDALLTPLFLAPIPGPSDFPLLRFGNRAYLEATLFNTDAELDGAFPSPQAGEVFVSLSTGRLRLSEDDRGKADPDDATRFDKHFFGEDVIYDGVALNQVPQPTKAPVQLVDSDGVATVAGSGDLFIPDMVTLPEDDYSVDIPSRGLGVSGILNTYDMTGATPMYASEIPGVRPGGDTLTANWTGRVRQVEDGVGDTIVFSKKGATTEIHVEDRTEDLPDRSYEVPKGVAYVAREGVAATSGATVSKVKLSRADLQEWAGEPVYFLQSTVVPATHTRFGRLVSRNRDLFRFVGDEVLYFNVDGITYTWLASSLPSASFYTPEEVAASINTVITGTGSAYALNGRLVIEAGDPDVGVVEIGWGTSIEKDLSGCAVLGFMPGWRAKGGTTNWLPDSGVGLGLYRSPINLGRTGATPDLHATGRVENIVLSADLQPTPFFFLNQPPLQDVAGIDEGVFFNFQTQIVEGEAVTLVNRPLQHYEDIIHRFGQLKFDWVSGDGFEGNVERATSVLGFGFDSIVPESMLGAPGIGGSFLISSDGGPAQFQDPDTDYVLPNEGVSGQALLVERFGSRVLSGALGQMTEGSATFGDTDADFSAVLPGYRLKVMSGDNLGSFVVEEVLSSTSLRVSPAALATTETPVVWSLYEGFTKDVYDPSLLADFIYQPFNHVLEEPFKTRLLSPLGEMPEDAAAQESARLVANMEAALESGRQIALRYGLTVATTSNTAALTALAQEELGPIANNSLQVPVGRISTESFSVRVGTTLYQHGSGLTGVANFSLDPGAGIEYLNTTSTDGAEGLLKFGSGVLAEFNTAPVWYVEEFLPAASLASNEAEYEPQTGTVNLSALDMSAWAGTEVYFVEQMITEERLDIVLSPQVGTFAFNSPVPAGSTVEVQYWRADLEGRKIGDEIVEFLPVFIRDEAAERQTDSVYHFNVAKNTVFAPVETIVYLGPVQQNFGTQDCIIDYPSELDGQGRITFLQQRIPTQVTVKVSYAVLEAQKGEQVYESSQKPIYRPPFFIKENLDRFGLRGDRQDDFEAGQLLRFGESCFYVRGVDYWSDSDITGIDIFPSTVDEVGSRAPANDAISVMTSHPITTVVDPDGSNPVATTAVEGFLFSIDTGVFPFEPISKGQKSITFLGDLTSFAVVGHLFEIGGYPYMISEVTLNDDGTRTKLSVTSGFASPFVVEDSPTVKLSYRPIYAPSSRAFIGVGPILQDEEYELVLYGESVGGVDQPGRTLRETVDYEIEPSSGNIQLLEPLQDPLQSGQSLSLSYTKIRGLQPFLQDGVVAFPRYSADFLHTILPNEDNGLQGGRVTGTYTFRNPDSFYFRIMTLSSFLAEAAQEAVDDIQSKRPAGGPILASVGGSENWEQGRFGLLSERRHLLDKDRAARTFLDFYNSNIVAFEQVIETINGAFIGDRDGKFRFYVGRDKEIPTPGFEDPIMGTLTPRNIWSEVFNEAEPSLDLWFIENDYVVDPSDVSMTDGVLEGWLPDADDLNGLLVRQGNLVQNDVDDVIMVRTGKPSVKYVAGPTPRFASRAKGAFSLMSDQHRFSRLFPTTTRAYTLTGPGVGADPDKGDPGVYTWGRVIEGKSRKTTGSTIAQLHNSVVGDITGVQTAALTKRYARGHVWGYFPDGIPAGMFDSGGSVALTRPCIVAFPVQLGDVPIDPETGYPDDSQLLSQGGLVKDALSGDPDLVVPGFREGDQIRWGQPDGDLYEVFYRQTIDIFGEPVLTGVFIEEVLYGCVITLMDNAGTSISDSTAVLAGVTPSAGIPLEDLPVLRGDTVYVGPSLGSQATGPGLPTDSPSFETIQTMSEGFDTYRSGFDLTIKEDGQVVDRTLPSFEDPSFFGLKEMFGQKPPDPVSAIEGPVEFLYLSQNPLRVPALSGLDKDDSGDYQIPYMRATSTELDRFDEIGSVLPGIVTTIDGTALPNGMAVYPDEALGSDGAVVGAIGVGFMASEPATLLSEQGDVEKWSHTTELGTGDVAQYDLLLMQVPSSLTFDGSTGIHSVGAVNSTGDVESLLEPPRFPTQTADLSLAVKAAPEMRYLFENYAGYVDPTPPPDPQIPPPPAPPLPPNYPGLVLIEDQATNEIWLDFQSINLPVLYDGQTMDMGGLNDISLANGNNVIRIDVYARTDPNVTIPAPSPGGDIVLSIFIQALWAWTVDSLGVQSLPFLCATNFGHDGGPAHTSPNMQIYMQPAGPIMPWAACPGGSEANWAIPHSLNGTVRQSLYGDEFTISVNTVSNALAVPPPPAAVPLGDGYSTTAWISPDRLTFNEVIDMQWMMPRGFTHPVSGLPMEASLHVESSLLTGGVDWCDIYSYANGGIPFTFLGRSGGMGSWVDATGGTVERGSVKVMAFEGHNNVAITGTDVTFSALPSNLNNATGVICGGTGKTESIYNANLSAYNQDRYDNRVTETSLSGGAISNVEPGDILVIKEGTDATYPATTKAGTYLVRHAVEPTAALYRETLPTTFVGTGAGWCPVEFPETVSFDAGTGDLTVSFLPEAPLSPVTIDGKKSGFKASGVVYIIRNRSGLQSSDATIYGESVISAVYTGITSPSTEAVFATTVWQDALGNLLTPAQVAVLLDKSYPVSGMSYLPMGVGGEQGLPDNNCVGFHDLGPAVQESVFGVAFTTLSTENLFGSGNTTDQLFDAKTGGAAGGIDVTSGAGWLGVFEGAQVSSVDFQEDSSQPVYPWVPLTMDIGGISAAQWFGLNAVAGSAGAAVAPANLYVRCLLPGSQAALGDLSGSVEGFYAQGGIFLEPTFPRSTLDLGSADPKVVDDARSLPNPVALNDWDRQVGMRDAASYGSTAVVPENVTFEVRRIRRFHNSEVGDAFKPLRYAYEIRRGIVTGYSLGNRQRPVLTAVGFTMDWNDTHPATSAKAPDVWNDGDTYTGTNLGAFNDPDVNINAGDLFRLLDDNLSVIEEVEIAGVESEGVLKLSAPLETANPEDYRFEIYLRQAPVPHEQSNDQLLDLITDQVVHQTDADWAADTGGYVVSTGDYSADSNKLYDSKESLSSAGVRKGDIVVIDPQGVLDQRGVTTLGEHGARPYGDVGLAGRAEHDPRAPSAFDDNRGFYRVREVVLDATPYLTLDPVSTFAGGPTSSSWVTFATGDFEYAVYPTVFASTVSTSGEEGQMDLRPTAARDGGGSFEGSALSIQPFSYKVIRPSGLYTSEAIDLVLTIRERMLSLIEMFRAVIRERKTGTYYDFQKDLHIEDLGSFLDIEDGLGVMSNAYIQSLVGEVGTQPYLNNSGCLSLLDRRFWIHDTKLDSLTGAGDGYSMALVSASSVGADPYTAYTDDTPGGGGEVLPVLPERVDLVLDNTDRFRPIRYVWLAYRTHKVLGTISGIRRFDEALPERQAEAERLVLMDETVEGVADE